MFRVFKCCGVVVLCLALLMIVALVVIYNQKIDRVPTTEVADVHQEHLISSEQVILFIIGDMGSPSEAQANVSRGMEQQCLQNKPDALVFLGDNIYPAGVESVNDPKWDNHLLSFYKSPCLADVPIYAILGNHDYGGNAQAQIDYTIKNDKWNMPFRYYDVSFGNIVNMVGTDMWFPDYCLFSSNCMFNFLIKSLKSNQEKTWRLVLGHYPINSASSRGGRHRWNIPGWILSKVLCANKADAYFAGHAHHLEHAVSGMCGMDLIISGSGGGSELYGVRKDAPKETRFVFSKHGFVQLIADTKRMQFTFFDDQAVNLYQYERLK